MGAAKVALLGIVQIGARAVVAAEDVLLVAKEQALIEGGHLGGVRLLDVHLVAWVFQFVHLQVRDVV